MFWNIIKLLVAVWIIKTCVVENELIIGLEDTIKEQFQRLFPKKKKGKKEKDEEEEEE